MPDLQNAGFSIRAAQPGDIALILQLIKELADYEKMLDQVHANEADLHAALFDKPAAAEALVGEYEQQIIAFALYFQNFSTFVGRSGLYLEDLYVKPAYRSRGFGRQLLAHLAKLACARKCARFEWSVLNWNEPAIKAYRAIGAVAMDEWTVYRLSGRALTHLAEQAD